MIRWIELIIFLMAYGGLVYACQSFCFRFFKKRRWFAANYEQKNIVTSFGAVLVIYYVLYAGLGYLWRMGLLAGAFYYKQLGLLIIFLSALALIGWIDDRYGTTHIKGFKGHVSALIMKGYVTTGLLKAVAGLCLAGGVAWFYSNSVLHWVLHTLVIVLSLHVINLFDVRPGRALKGFGVLAIFILPWLSYGALVTFTVPVAIGCLLLFQLDKQRLMMLGDAGTIVLGGILGFLIMVTHRLEIAIIYIIFLASLTILAERISFNSYIERQHLLARFDRWGIR